MNGLKKTLRTFLGVPVTIISFIFIGKLFLDHKATILPALSNIDLLYFSLGILFFFLFFFVKAVIWIQILKRRNFNPEAKSTIFDYSISEAKRYIPGSIFAFIGRVHSHSNSIPAKETVKSIGVEIAILSFSALIVSIPAMLYFFKKLSFQVEYFPIIIAILSIICIATLFYLATKHISILRKFSNLTLLYIVGWIIFGIANFFTLISITPVTTENLPVLLSLFIFSWLIGYLFFVTPMGLGIRELSLVYFLSSFTPFGIATTVAIISRLSMTIGEMLFLTSAYFLKKTKKIPTFISSDYFRTLAFILSVAYFFYFSFLSVIKHSNFYSGRFDLGNMTQTVWNTANGNFFMLTNPDGVSEISRLGVHSDFILILFAPLYLLFPSPNVLLIIQSLVIAMGGFFLYLVGNAVLKNRKIAFAFSVSYFLNFWVHYQNLFDFHAVSLSTGFLIAMFYFLVRKQTIPFLIFLTLAVLTKENVFLASCLVGIYLFAIKRRRLGVSVSLLSFFFFVFLTQYAIPQARGNEHFALSYYSYLGNSPMEIIKNFFVKPEIISGQIFSFENLHYIHMLLIPSGYLSLLSPVYLLFAVPDFAIYTLSSNHNLRQQYYHYGALIIPFVYISSIFSVKKIISVLNYKFLPTSIFYYVLGIALVSAYFYSPLPGMKNAAYQIFDSSKTSTIKNYLSVIPEGSSVAASNNIGAHLSHRKWIFVIPKGMENAEYIVLYNENDEIRGAVNQLFYEAVVDDKKLNFIIYKRSTLSLCGSCQP